MPFTVPPARSDPDALTILREMIASLGERVELLEAREQLARPVYQASGRLRPRS